MIANYHTHTVRCRHAQGADEDFVQEALAKGLKILGFADHTPYFFPGDHYSTMRMFPEELEGYAESILSLKEAYSGQIDIALGLEAEYYPQLFGKLLPVLQDAGIEYLILGQHWCGNEIGEIYNYHHSEDPNRLARYCDQVIEAMETGLFTYVAHPDLLRFEGDPDQYRLHMGRLCAKAKELDIPLEINLLGLSTHRLYPNPLFWEIAGEVGCKAVLGSDAHRPDNLVLPETIQEAEALAKANDLTLLDTVPLRRISNK